MIYLDGGVVQTGGEDPLGNIHFDPNSIPANQLLAVEVFRGAAETPARFNAPASTCGVVLIWTTARLPTSDLPPLPGHMPTRRKKSPAIALRRFWRLA
jgi:hypothetical protein